MSLNLTRSYHLCSTSLDMSWVLPLIRFSSEPPSVFKFQCCAGVNGFLYNSAQQSHECVEDAFFTIPCLTDLFNSWIPAQQLQHDVEGGVWLTLFVVTSSFSNSLFHLPHIVSSFAWSDIRTYIIMASSSDPDPWQLNPFRTHSTHLTDVVTSASLTLV